MKKVFLITASLFLSSQVFAHPFIYKGNGAYKDRNGGGGHYEITVTKRHTEDGYKRITTQIFLNNQEMSWTVNLKSEGHETFSVYDANLNPIGEGYCFEEGDGHLCHMDATSLDGVKCEKTVMLTLDNVYGMGSRTLTDGQKIMWKDQLKRIYPADEQSSEDQK